MALGDFNHLPSSIKTLSPVQAKKLRQQVDERIAELKKRPLASSGKAAKRAGAAQPPNKPPSIDELHRRMMERGLIARLPDPALDVDDDGPDDQPVPIEGEPLSETILRERR